MSETPALGVISRGQVAVLLGVDEVTVARWEKTYSLPVIKVGRKRYYDPEKVKAWLAAQPT